MLPIWRSLKFYRVEKGQAHYVKILTSEQKKPFKPIK